MQWAEIQITPFSTVVRRVEGGVRVYSITLDFRRTRGIGEEYEREPVTPECSCLLCTEIESSGERRESRGFRYSKTIEGFIVGKSRRFI